MYRTYGGFFGREGWDDPAMDIYNDSILASTMNANAAMSC